jgi:hypothetical protein
MGLDQRFGSFTAGDIRRFQGHRIKVAKDFQGVAQGTAGVFRDGIREPGASGWMATVEWTDGPHAGKSDCLTRSEFVSHLVFTH